MSDISPANNLPHDLMVDITVTVRVPRSIRLDVGKDVNGRLWPAVGLAWQRLLTADELVAQGIQVTWGEGLGPTLDPDAARSLITQREADYAAGYRPTFDTVTGESDASPTAG